MAEEILSQGAEAIITQRGEEVTKKRISKSYRLSVLDEKIRKYRTRGEAKLLEKASKVIPVPKVLKVDEEKKEIIMESIEGKRLSNYLDKFSAKEQERICKKIGENIAKLHNENIIHGDLTTANMILVEDENKMPAYSHSQVIDNKTNEINNKKTSNKLNRNSSLPLTISSGRAGGEANNSRVYFIDFGLGFISSKIEDKSVDLHLLREAFEAGFAEKWEKLFDAVKENYSKNYKDVHLVIERFKAVEKRGRYKQGS